MLETRLTSDLEPPAFASGIWDTACQGDSHFPLAEFEGRLLGEWGPGGLLGSISY